MAVETPDEGNLLREPSDTSYSHQERVNSSYKPFNTFHLAKDKQYQQQYADMYFLRLMELKPKVEQIASEAWDGFRIGGEEVRRVERVLDVRQGELVWVTGMIYMDMPLKPNILEDISKDHWISAPPPREKYISVTGDDMTMLEDESGRLRLIGLPLTQEMLVTGCVVAVMGTENANGDFEVADIRVPDLPPQPKRWEKSKPASTAKNGSSKIAIVSGLGISGTSADNSLQIDLLLEYLLGEALAGASQAQAAQISRLIIAGNALAAESDSPTTDVETAKKSQKKYGYDSSAYNPAPIAHLDNFLAALLPSMPVTLIPGQLDPANVSLPQQPVHPAMFPQARAYVTRPPAAEEDGTEPSWFDSVTNPWDGEVEGWRFLGTGGQNVDDVFKYVETTDRLGMMEAMCRWRCIAPTAPDTLWSYPFQDADPFVLEACPHVFFVGSQSAFDTAVIEGPGGQTVRLLAVPRFSETGEIVLVDSETLEVERVKISIQTTE